jgi:carbonic anhydrase
MSSSWEPFGSTRRQAEDAAREPAQPAAQEPGAPSEPAPSSPPPSAMRRNPSRKLVVITCMDGRIDPLKILGLGLGEANVLRNAGATISDDVLRSLRVSQSQLGTRRAVLIGHTNCAGYPSDEAAEAAVSEGVRRIRDSPAVPDSFGVEGLLYDIAAGTLRPVT